MELIRYKNTYGYSNFITEDERISLLKWALDSQQYLHYAQPMNNEENQTNKVRHFNSIYQLPSFPPLITQLKEKIATLENLLPFLNIPVPNDDWIGIIGKGGFVEPHKDGNLPNHYTRRYNILLQHPHKGGLPIYDNQVVDVKPRDIWRCDAGLLRHTSQIVEGDVFRVNLALSFSIPKKPKK